MNDLPANIEAEQQLLGAILVSNDIYYQTTECISAADFFEPLHARIYEACASLIDSGRKATPVTLAPYFEDDSAIQEVGGTEYLVRMAAACISPLLVNDFARTLRDLSIRRQVIAAALAMAEEARAIRVGDDPLAPAQAAAETVYRVLDGATAAETWAEGERAISEALDRAQRVERGDVVAVPTGLKRLDGVLGGGLWPGQAIYLGARPKMGKTTKALRIAMAALNAGFGVSYFTNEHSRHEMEYRRLSSWLKEQGHDLPYQDIQRGKIDEGGWRLLDQARIALQDKPIIWDDAPALTMAQIRTRVAMHARRFQRRDQRLGLVVIDQLTHVKPSSHYRGNKAYELEEISGAVKELAKAFGVPVLALSQLNREVDKRDDPRPTKTDFRATGAFEQDCDVMLLLYREEVTLKERKPEEGKTVKWEEWRDKLQRAENKIEINVAMQRSGPAPVTIDAYCDVSHSLITALSEPAPVQEGFEI